MFAGKSELLSKKKEHRCFFSKPCPKKFWRWRMQELLLQNLEKIFFGEKYHQPTNYLRKPMTLFHGSGTNNAFCPTKDRRHQEPQVSKAPFDDGRTGVQRPGADTGLVSRLNGHPTQCSRPGHSGRGGAEKLLAPPPSPRRGRRPHHLRLRKMPR